MSTDKYIVTRQIMVCARSLRSVASERLQEMGISMAQYPFLVSLLLHEGCSQDELADRVFMDKGCTARAIRALEKEGLVRREHVPGNRRMNRLYLTEKARAFEERILDIVEATNLGLTADFSDEERETFLRLLNKAEVNGRAMSRTGVHCPHEENGCSTQPSTTGEI